MANVWWNKEGANAAWATHDQNWWNNVLHRSGTDENGQVPQTNDSLYFLGSTAPADDGAAETYALIDTSELTDDFTFTDDVTVTGSLVIGVPGTTDVHTWQGDGSAVGSAILQGASVLSGVGGQVGPDSIFKDTASIENPTAALMGRLNFHDSSGVTGATFLANSFSRCYGNHTFTEADGNLVVTNHTFYVYGSLTINNTATNTITGTPTIVMMNRNAQFLTVGTVVANVVPYRLATAHRLRHIG